MADKFNFNDYPEVKQENKSKFNFDEYPTIEQEKNIIPQQRQSDTFESVQQEHPFTYGIGKYLAKHPSLGKGVQYAAEIAGPTKEFIETLGLPQTVAGIVQGVGNAGISAANVPLSVASELSGKNLRLPMGDIEKMVPGHERGGHAFDIGELGGELYSGGKAYGSLNKLMGGRGKGFTGYLGDILKGAGAGYLTGASKKGEGELSDIGRIFSGIGGAGAAAIGSGIKSGAKEINKLKSTNIAKDIIKGAKQEEKVSNSLYENSIGKAKEAGIDLGMPKIPVEHRRALLKSVKKDPTMRPILEDGPSFLKKSTKKWLFNPSIKNTHSLTKDLAKTSREYGSHGASVIEKDMTKASSKLRDELVESIHSSFKKAGREDLSEAFLNANTHYQEKVLPYRIAPIMKYRTKKFGLGKGMTESDLIKSLTTNKDFKLALSKQYPEIARKNILKKLGIWGGSGAAAGLGIPYAYHGIKHGVENILSD